MMQKGGMWLTDNLPLRHNPDSRNTMFKLKIGWTLFLIWGGAFIMVAGSYGAITGIVQEYAISPGQSFSCADDS